MTFTLNKKLPNMVYYNDDHRHSFECTDQVIQILKATYTLPSNWEELTKEIANGEDKIVFHIDMITKSGSTMKNFINSMNLIAKFAGHNKLKIAVLITPHTTQQQVQELKESGALCLGFDINYYPAEKAAISTQNLIAGTPYWPEDIISQLPVEEKKPLQVVFRKNVNEHIKKIIQVIPEFKSLLLQLPVESMYCESWDELSEVLKLDPHQVLIHPTLLGQDIVTMHEIISMIDTLRKVVTSKKIPIGIVIETDTPIRLIKECQKSGVLGIVPGTFSFGFNETQKGVEALFNRIPYWPKHILNQLPGAKPVTTKNTIQLTYRQNQVFDLIRERGASNKTIARMLGISESTVKLHITEIFKKYGVRNRTQLAVFPHS